MLKGRGIWRGKSVDFEKWIEGYFAGYFLNERGENAPHILRSDDGDLEEVIPETLGECTGLKDKNGVKRIFEGDIITYEDETPGQYEYHDSLFMNRGEIRFCDGSFYFTNSIAATMEDLLLGNGTIDCTVIGNVYDNPELLEGGDE